MAKSYSTMGLHFRYRLWIAEMNSHINIIRIFDDYITELSSKRHEPAVKKGIENFGTQFIELRKQIDDLRHEMHLAKMALAAESKQSKGTGGGPIPKSIHAALKRQYLRYRRLFERTKKEFAQFENKWLA